MKLSEYSRKTGVIQQLSDGLRMVKLKIPIKQNLVRYL